MKSIVDFYISNPEQVLKVVDSLEGDVKKEFSYYWGEFLIKGAIQYKTGNQSVKLNPNGKFVNLYYKSIFGGRTEIKKTEFIEILLKEVREQKNKVKYNRYNILDLDG